MIHFHKIRFKNFLSYGNRFTEIYLDRASTTLIIGANGAGKSTMLDALCFGLFNKPFRKVKKGQLVNSINQRECVVEIEFRIGSREYKVVRGMKPAIFEIYMNDQLLNQDSKNRDYQKNLEEQILKMNYKTFTQVVILGNSFVPFMQLSAVDRRSIIEDLLDIQIFSDMNVLLKQRLNDLREKALVVDSEIRIANDRIEMQQKYIDNLKKDKKKLIRDNQGKLEEVDRRIEEVNGNIDRINALIEERMEKIDVKEKLNEKHTKIDSLLYKLEHKLRSKSKQLDILNENDVCPTCTQSMDSEHVHTLKEEREEQIVELNDAIKELNGKSQKLMNQLNAISDIQRKINDLQRDVHGHNVDIRNKTAYRKQLQEEIEKLKAEDSKSITSEVEKLNAFEQDVLDIRDKKDDIIEEAHYHNIVGILLKDSGIKTKIISQYLPIMNQTINKYLNMLDFSVSFELNENFDETIKSRYRDDFSYSSFSEGEKQRIDLALLFTWRDIAKMRNSANTNLLILDEVFDSSLDDSGTEEFMKLLKTLTKKTNTFIISHHGDALYDKFNACLHFQKNGNFSSVTYVGQTEQEKAVGE
jgi:DNA repair exonuclease SbcCD ATPase subunit